MPNKPRNVPRLIWWRPCTVEPWLGRRKLGQARFLLRQAEAIGAGGDREAYWTYVEAAIAFGQSVEDHLHREHVRLQRLCRRQGLDYPEEFETWYAAARERANADRLLDLVKELREMIMHEAPAALERVFEVTTRGTLLLSDGPATPSADLARAARPEPPAQVRVSVHLIVEAGSPWEGRQIADLLRDYLDRLDGLVQAAAEVFPYTAAPVDTAEHLRTCEFHRMTLGQDESA